MKIFEINRKLIASKDIVSASGFYIRQICGDCVDKINLNIKEISPYSTYVIVSDGEKQQHILAHKLLDKDKRTPYLLEPKFISK